jgi:signal transduction histidine kinase
MSFRAKVLISIAATTAIAVWLVAYLIASKITRTYETREAAHAAAVVAQFRRELDRRSGDIAARVTAIAASDEVTRIASHADARADLAQYVNAAEPLAREQSLDLLTIVAPTGAIISSAHWPARFGYAEELVKDGVNWNSTPVFLKREELAEGSVLGLVAVRSVEAGDSSLYVVGGTRLDPRFVESLAVPQGMRVSVYREGEDVRTLAPDLSVLLGQVRASGREQTRLVQTSAGEEVATAIPLAGRDNKVLAVLLALQSRNELHALKRQVYVTAFFVGLAAVLVGLALGFWAASRVTRPVRRLASATRRIAAGDWDARAEVQSRDEVGQLANDFNGMAAQLSDQRNRMLQAERVAAWRELARRLAHELKNPLFPLQLTVENLRRSRESEDFDEVFTESTSTLLTEINNLKTIINRFGDFARMPTPQFETVDVNQIARETMKLFEAQLQEPGKPAVKTKLDLDPDLAKVQADPEQMRRALRNLALNALDAMPEGGALAIRTFNRDGRIVIEVADSGAGIAAEERARLFTPYYTTKQHGTGLGLAIVQSVVSDHGGTITVDSEPGRGSTFRIELKHEQTAAGR